MKMNAHSSTNDGSVDIDLNLLRSMLNLDQSSLIQNILQFITSIINIGYIAFSIISQINFIKI